MKYFKLNEFIKSATAKKYNIDNTPSEKVIENINLLVDNMLDPLREAWGSGILITSGYRCKELNEKVNGVKNSSHLEGNAADIYPMNGKIYEFIDFVKEWSKDRVFDQIIIERKGYSKWLHCSWKSNKNEQRKRIFKMNVV